VTIRNDTVLLLKKEKLRPGEMAHTCKPIYLGSRDSGINNVRPAQAKKVREIPIQ
jgi:hypothetical protein